MQMFLNLTIFQNLRRDYLKKKKKKKKKKEEGCFDIE